MQRLRGMAIGLMVLSPLVAGLASPPTILAGEPEPELTATLDGKPIPLQDVGRYFCDDFDYPEIRCSSSRVLAQARGTLVMLLTAIEYVTIYDGTFFSGSYMNVSQDYAVLATIGWSDRISSFKGRNGETGTFYVDWFYGGSWYAFCCNTQVANLGSYSNVFSSILRT